MTTHKLKKALLVSLLIHAPLPGGRAAGAQHGEYGVDAHIAGTGSVHDPPGLALFYAGLVRARNGCLFSCSASSSLA